MVQNEKKKKTFINMQNFCTDLLKFKRKVINNELC